MKRNVEFTQLKTFPNSKLTNYEYAWSANDDEGNKNGGG